MAPQPLNLCLGAMRPKRMKESKIASWGHVDKIKMVEKSNGSLGGGGEKKMKWDKSFWRLHIYI